MEYAWIVYDESGVEPDLNPYVWTGTHAVEVVDGPIADNGRGEPHFELGSTPYFYSTSAAIRGIAYPQFNGSYWLYFGHIDGLMAENNFYAMSGVLTVVPEPSTLVLAGLAVAGLAASSLRRRRQSQKASRAVRRSCYASLL
jgi:hypothetical protein